HWSRIALRGKRDRRGRKRAVTMKVFSRMNVAIFSLCLAFLVAPLCPAQGQADTAQTSSTDVSQRIKELEKQVNELRSELAALTGGSGSAAMANSTPPPQNNLAPTSGSATATPAGPSLAGLLGPTTLSGFVDTYYGQNFNNPASRNNMLRAFDLSTNQFGLNLVELVADKQPDANNSRTGYHIALGFGQAMNVVNGTDPGGLGFDQYLKEAYFSYLAPVGKGLQVDVGKFVTPHGAEVIETKDNWNYSRGLLFSYAIPYYHFGMRAKYAFNDKYSLTGSFVNGWNNVIDNNTGKTYGLSFGWNPNKKLGLVQTYLAGPEENSTNHNLRQLSDTVITYSPTGKLSFMVNGDYGRGDRFITDTALNTFSHPVFWTGVGG